MITFDHKGNFSKTLKYMKSISTKKLLEVLNEYGEKGLEALKNATPVDTGLTASSWRYFIEYGDSVIRLVYVNDNIQNGENIAIILQYGHGTRYGGWVEGRDYINPAVQPIFDAITEKVWEAAKNT